MESNAQVTLPTSPSVNGSLVAKKNMCENGVVETLIDKEPSNASDEDYESEVLVSRETFIQHSEEVRSRRKYHTTYQII